MTTTEKTLKVSSGANSFHLPYANAQGKTITEIRDSLREVLNVGNESQAVVDGTNVSDTFVLGEVEELEFVKESGEKG